MTEKKSAIAPPPKKK